MLPGRVNQACGSVKHRLQSVKKSVGQTGEGCVAVVQARKDQQHDKRLQNWSGDRPTDASELA